MTHTIWMHGQQIGETKLEYKHTGTRFAGAFHPTEFGLTLLPGITAMGPALFEFGEMCRRQGIDTEDASEENASAALTAFAHTPEGRRVLDAARQISQLEVRDPDGKRVLWESLNITDLEWMVAVARKHKPELVASIDELPEHEPIKFMLTITVHVPGPGTRPMRSRMFSKNVCHPPALTAPEDLS